MHSDTSFPPAPVNEAPVESVPPPQARPPLTRPAWRWWVHLCIIASYPIFSALSASVRYTDGEPKLPSKVAGLLLFCALQIAVSGAFWGLAWSFSRATKDELWLRWRGGWRPPIWGFGYAIALLSAEVLVILLTLGTLMSLSRLMGLDPHRGIELFRQNQPQTKGMLSSLAGNHNVLYQILVVTLLSFVVAGGSEELWRVSTMAGVIGVAPASWSLKAKNNLAIGVAAVIFGIGHSYQGWMGVIATGLIGVVLGAITIKHRNVWPAVIAHGFFDAITFFLALSTAKPH